MYRVTLHCAPLILLLHLAFSSLFTFQRSFFPALLSPSHYALPFTVLFIRKSILSYFCSLYDLLTLTSHLSLFRPPSLSSFAFSQFPPSPSASSPPRSLSFIFFHTLPPTPSLTQLSLPSAPFLSSHPSSHALPPSPPSSLP